MAVPSLRGAERRSNPDCRRGNSLDCFASLAMTRVDRQRRRRRECGQQCAGRLQHLPRLAIMVPEILGQGMTAAAGVSGATEKSTTAHVVWASALGTAIEWYDFLIYGTAAAL